MNRRFEAWFDAVIARSPAPPLFRWFAKTKLAVLAYHGITDADRFAAQLDLIGRKAHPVGLDDVFEAMHGGGRLPQRPVLITFDDADATLMTVGLPLLRERGLPAVAFVAGATLGTERPLWPGEARDLVRFGGTARGVEGLTPDEVVRTMKRLPDEERVAVLEELRSSARGEAGSVSQLGAEDLATIESSGIEIGNHTMTHPCLNRCTDDRIADEVSEAHHVLWAATGRPPRAFAYPNGDVDVRVARIVQELGYQIAFLFDHRLNSVPVRDPLRVSRLRVNSTDSLDRFGAVTSGLHPAFHAVRSRKGGRTADGSVLEPAAGRAR